MTLQRMLCRRYGPHGVAQRSYLAFRSAPDRRRHPRGRTARCGPKCCWGGVTSVVDMYWSEAAVFDAVDRAGMRALLCASYLDTRLEAFESDLPALVEKCEGSLRIRAGLAPHAAYTCSAENLRRGMEACRRYGIPMTTHIAETLDEVRMIRERYGATPVEYLDSQGVLDGGADRRTLRAPDRRGSPHPARAGRARGALPDEQHEDRERCRADRTAAHRRGELHGGHRRPQFEQRSGHVGGDAQRFVPAKR